VTTTVDKPKALWSGPLVVSTVWIRDIGAIRQVRQKYPVSEYTAVSVTSQRWTRCHQTGITAAETRPITAMATAGPSSHGRAGAVRAPSTANGTAGTAVAMRSWTRHHGRVRLSNWFLGGRSLVPVAFMIGIVSV